MKKNSILATTARIFALAAFTFTAALFTGCSDDVADAPEIKVYVNGTQFTGTQLEVSQDEVLHYRFEVTAFTTIADLKLIEYDIMNEELKIPTETLVGGLTFTLNEVVEGYVTATNNAEYRLVVKDIDGNEVSAGFSYYIP